MFQIRLVYIFLYLLLAPGLFFGQIVNDSINVIYGTNTTKIFTQERVYRNEVVFYKKDSLFSPMFVSKPPKVPITFNASWNKPGTTTGLHATTLPSPMVDSTSETGAGSDSTYYKKRSLKAKTPRKAKVIPYEDRFFKNTYIFHRPDTLVSDIHNYNFLYIRKNIYQNLGLIGTPSKQVFYTLPASLGYQSGFTVYDVYLTDPSKINYYNTRSTYTKFYYMANTGDENNITFEFSRNITRHWNFGFYYQRLNSNKQFALAERNKNSLSSNQDFKIFTSFKSSNERYHFMGNFTYFVSKTNEQGGLRENVLTNEGFSQATPDKVPDQLTTWPSMLSATDAKLEPYNNKGAIFSRDRRVAYHFYHQYDIQKRGRLSVFHEFDHRNQKIRYTDPLAYLNTSSMVGQAFYPIARRPIDTIYTVNAQDSVIKNAVRRIDTSFFNNEYNFVTNRLGVKGNVGDHTWILYYKQRDIFYGNSLSIIKAGDIVGDPVATYEKFLTNDPGARLKINEFYGGGELIARFSDSMSLAIKGEGQFALNNQSGNDTLKKMYQAHGDHMLSALFTYRNFEAGITRSFNSPAMYYNYLDHSNYYWTNHFAAVSSNRIHASGNWKLGKRHYLQLSPSFTSIYNYVFVATETLDDPLTNTLFTQSMRPRQLRSDQPIFLSVLDLSYQTNAGPLNFELFAKYTAKSGDGSEYMRMPALYANAKLYLKLEPRKKKGRQQFLFGVDFHYRSAYFGDGYNPALLTYYVQNNFELKEYPLADIFIDVKLRNARVFARLNQANSILNNIPNLDRFQSNGYYVTPYYPSVRSVITFGFSWMFFD